MSALQSWPTPLKQYLYASFGRPTDTLRLNGILPNRGSHRVLFGTRSVIVKRFDLAREWTFYAESAPPLRQMGVGIPEVYWLGEHAGEYWGVLEDIPGALPKSRWGPDPQVVEMLCRMHAGTWGNLLVQEDAFVPAWDTSMSEQACSRMRNVSEETERDLERIRMAAQALFRPACNISGDPNPTNWGIRADGTLSHYDWERFGAGTPAIDLAIILPGMGSLNGETERTTVSLYTSAWERTTAAPCPLPEPDLYRDIHLAKVWTAVEFLALRPDAPARTVERLEATFQQKVKDTAALLWC